MWSRLVKIKPSEQPANRGRAMGDEIGSLSITTSEVACIAAIDDTPHPELNLVVGLAPFKIFSKCTTLGELERNAGADSSGCATMSLMTGSWDWPRCLSFCATSRSSRCESILVDSAQEGWTTPSRRRSRRTEMRCQTHQAGDDEMRLPEHECGWVSGFSDS